MANWFTRTVRRIGRGFRIMGGADRRAKKKAEKDKQAKKQASRQQRYRGRTYGTIRTQQTKQATIPAAETAAITQEAGGQAEAYLVQQPGEEPYVVAAAPVKQTIRKAALSMKTGPRQQLEPHIDDRTVATVKQGTPGMARAANTAGTARELEKLLEKKVQDAQLRRDIMLYKHELLKYRITATITLYGDEDRCSLQLIGYLPEYSGMVHEYWLGASVTPTDFAVMVASFGAEMHDKQGSEKALVQYVPGKQMQVRRLTIEATFK